MGRDKKCHNNNSAQGLGDSTDISLFVPIDIFGVIVSDLFDKSFEPICSTEIPKPLLPLNKKELIDYALDFLWGNTVNEVLVLVRRKNYNAVELRINNYLKKLKDTIFRVECIALNDSIVNICDALRELDGIRDIRRDFVLILGDTFCVADIRSAIYQHEKRKESNSDQILTKIFACSNPAKNTRQLSDDCVVVYDEYTLELVAIESFKGRQAAFTLDSAQLLRNSSTGKIRVRYDLLDPFIMICSPKILQLLAESFDYLSMEGDFIPNLLNKEIKSEQIYIYLLSSGLTSNNHYAARVTDPRTLLAVTCDILDKWTYPVVVDSQSILLESPCHYTGNDVYMSKSVETGFNTDISTKVCIDDYTKIEDRAKIECSTIGKNCKIGKNATIIGSIIFDNVVVEDNAQILHSLIYKNSVIKSGAVVNNGCIIGGNVIIGRCASVPENSRISIYPRDLIHEKNRNENLRLSLDQIKVLSDAQIVGDDGLGILWENDESSRDKDELSLGERIQTRIMLPLPEIDDFLDEEYKNILEIDYSSTLNLVEDDETSVNPDDRFMTEVQLLVSEGLTKPELMHHKILELKGYKMASNKKNIDIVLIFLPIVLEFLSSTTDKKTWAKLVKSCHIDSLFDSFCKFSDDDSEYYCLMLYDEILNFSMKPFLSTFSSQEIPNPFFGNTNFSFLCECVEFSELIEMQYLPGWVEDKIKLQKNANYFCNKRMVAFIEWLAAANESDSP